MGIDADRVGVGDAVFSEPRVLAERRLRHQDALALEGAAQERIRLGRAVQREHVGGIAEQHVGELLVEDRLP